MPLVLGTTPDTLKIIFMVDADWSVDLEAENDDATPYVWPAHTRIWLQFKHDTLEDPIEWDAAVSGSLVRWRREEAEVETIPTGAKARLFMEDTTDEFSTILWASGSVSRKG